MSRLSWIGCLAIAWPASLLALMQPPRLPTRPVAPDAAYPNCTQGFVARTGASAQLADLRLCRSSTEHFENTYLTAFKARLRIHSNSLQRYRDAIDTATMTPEQRSAALAAYEDEKAQVESGGDLYEAERRLSDRARRDLGFIGSQICRIRGRRGSSCV